MSNDAFQGLVAIVQYRRSGPDYDPWHNMAAFDSRSMADQYAIRCANETWEYQVMDGSGSRLPVTLLYRSPSITLGDHDWHVTVQSQKGYRPTTIYHFRRIDAKKWQQRDQWKGNLPEGFTNAFQSYAKSCRRAMDDENARIAARMSKLRKQVFGVGQAA